MKTASRTSFNRVGEPRSRLVRGKLASTSGASIVFAVVIFAIASIFCVTIVNAGLSSAGNARDQIADEQDFLAASSAAKLLQDIVPGAGNTVRLEGLDAVTAAEMRCTVPTTAESARPVLMAMGNSLLPAGAEGKRESKTITLNARTSISNGADAPSTDMSLPTVEVTMIPAEDPNDFDVTALVKGEKGNAMAVYFKGSASKSGEVTNVNWQVESVGKQKPAKSSGGKQGE